MWFFIFESLALLSIASVVGVVAGFLVWGGRPTPAPSSAAAVGADQAHLWAEINSRNADVERLRHKLKRAVVELERRAQQVVAAREAHDNLLVQVDTLGAQLAIAQDAHPFVSGGISESGGSGQALGDEERVQLEQQVADHRARLQQQQAEQAASSARIAHAEEERKLAQAELARARAEASDARTQVQELESQLHAVDDDLRRAREQLTQTEAEASDLQQKADECHQQLATAEHTYEGRLASLEVDLSSARLRTETASGELLAFRNDLGQLHDANARHLADSHTTIGALRARLDRASAALTASTTPQQSTVHPAEAEPVAPAAKTSGPPAAIEASTASAPPASGAPVIDLRNLQLLPGVDQNIAGHLEELGVESLTDIAEWTESDVERFQAWLPDHPRIVADNDWVAVAVRLVAQSSGTHGEDPGDPAGIRERS